MEFINVLSAMVGVTSKVEVITWKNYNNVKDGWGIIVATQDIKQNIEIVHDFFLFDLGGTHTDWGFLWSEIGARFSPFTEVLCWIFLFCLC